MRRGLLYLGALGLASGIAMNLLLGQLKSDFFRAYLPPWILVSYAVVVVGGLALVAGITLGGNPSPAFEARKASRLTATLALVNAVAASIFVAPVLDPALRFPILITQWPGIYMVIAYVAFVLVGVLGLAVWALLFAHTVEMFGNSGVGRIGFAAQILLTESGVYGLAISMFLGGYVGSWLAYTGAGPVAVGAQMEFSVIPSAVSIFAVMAGTVVGVANLLGSRRST